MNLNSCETVDDMDYSYSIKDALKISAYLFDENSGEDYFVFDSLGNYDYNTDESFCALEQLKMNEVRLMCPLGLFRINLNIYFEFDGIIEVISEDNDVQMFCNPQNRLEPITGSGNHETYGFELKLPFGGFIAANPLGSNRGHLWTSGIQTVPYSLGREYYLNVNAYKFDNEQTPVIKAQLKLVLLEDKTIMGHAALASACFSIELVSYEYSDIYKILDEITYEEEDK